MEDKKIAGAALQLRATFQLAAIISLLLFIAHVVIAQNSPTPPHEDMPFFSARAVVIHHDYGAKLKAAVSPDGKKKVSIELTDEHAGDSPARISVETEQGRFSAIIRFGIDTEILWSPDSLAFAVTGSSGGANGPYEMEVFRVLSGKLVNIGFTALVTTAFGNPVKCSWPEPPNVAAIKWLVPSKQLLVAAEIIHHSNCDSYGTFKGFVVDVNTNRVVKALNQLEVKRLYHDDLGEELLQADDRCIRHPASCYVSGNHQ